MEVAVAGSTPAILSEIVSWAEGLQGWQRDALRRIVENGNIAVDDIEELTTLCRHANGLPEEHVPDLRPLQREHVSAGEVMGTSVTLRSIAQPENVNALDESQQLDFAPSGLTVVFGYNGSGKSGYGRILRRACRARKKGDPILPNVMKPTKSSSASAELTYALDDAEQPSEQWIDGVRAIDALGSVSFFDSDCATVHVCDRNDIAFTPFGLDVLPKLGAACKAVQSRLDAEKKRLEDLQPKFLKSSHAIGETAVGKLLKSLRYDTDFESVTPLASLTGEELQRLKELPAHLANDAAKTGRELRTRAGRVSSLRDALIAAANALSPDAIRDLKTLASAADRTLKAAEAAAKMSFTNEPLPQIGEPVWRELWEAARRYSGVAYPDQDFPVVDAEGSVCVLCQQPLGEAAKDRLRGFERFVADDTAKRAQQAKVVLQSAIQKLESLGLRDEALREQLKDVDATNPEIAKSVRDALATLLRRLRTVEAAHASGNWSFAIPTEAISVESELATLVTTLTAQAAEIEKSADAEERKKLEAELAELQAREWLATVLGDVNEHISRLKEIKKLQDCIADTRTNQITAKSKQLAKQYVTDQLRNAFASEIKKMQPGVRRLNIELVADAGEYGASYYRVQLVGAHKTGVELVVSEGEHRCIALAGFLSELTTEQSQSAIVLDDPVSSLDYVWSECFARRLVEEAATRQVIVLTHDVLFLHDLCSFAEESGVLIETKQVQAIGDSCGHVGDELPNDLQGLKARIDTLEKEQAAIRRLFESNGDGYEMRVKAFYDRLRAAVERAVEERVFNGVIFRFRNEVKVGLLPKVAAFVRQDAEDLHKLHIKCSENITGHDRAALRSGTRLTPSDLKIDLEELQRIVKDLNTRQNGM